MPEVRLVDEPSLYAATRPWRRDRVYDEAPL